MSPGQVRNLRPAGRLQLVPEAERELRQDPPYVATPTRGPEVASGCGPGSERRSLRTLNSLAGLRVLERLGEGRFTSVYHARWNDRDVAIKVYKSPAVERFARKHRTSLAEYEYSRNLAFYEAPGLLAYVAKPLGYLLLDGVSAFIQEKLDGELYYFYYRQREGKVSPLLFRQVKQAVRLYHAAGLYDVDLHSMNVMVVSGPEGEPVPKLFDFNKVPFHVHPNGLVWFLLKLGLMSRRTRDLRKLRNFHKFGRVETKLVKFYK